MGFIVYISHVGAVPGPVRFALDVDSPFATELLESFLEAADAVGVHVVWGNLSGTCLELVASSEVPQVLIVSILETKMHSKDSSPQAPAITIPAAGVDSFSGG